MNNKEKVIQIVKQDSGIYTYLTDKGRVLQQRLVFRGTHKEEGIAHADYDVVLEDITPKL